MTRRKFEHQMPDYYDARASEYEQIYYREIPERRREIDNEAAHLQKQVSNKTVLDIACGTGYWTKVMGETAHSIVATDLSAEMIKQAEGKKYQCPVQFVQADLYHLPVAPQSFDIVTLGFWFSHHPRRDYDRLFEALRSVVKPDGQIWLIDNNPPAEGPTLDSVGTDSHGDNFKERRLDNGEKFVILKNYFKPDELRSIFSGCFKLKQLTYGHYYWSIWLNSYSSHNCHLHV